MQTVINPAATPRVLVVEDEPFTAKDILERLTRMGFQVVGMVDNAEDAVQAAQRELPELVLMDIVLKGKMDGIEAAAKIRQDLNIPVIYLTAYSDKETRARAMETAPCGYVLKPFREDDLLVAIETAIHLSLQERRLKESEVRYSATLASIVDGVIATDEDGRVTFMNPLAEELTGWKFPEAHGVAIEEVLKFVSEADKKPLENPVRRALQQRTAVLLTDAKLIVGREGICVPVDDNAAPITTQAGIVIGAVVAFRDLRLRRVTENALRKTEEQLRQSQKLDAIGRLAGGVAHDFNNLLTIINGCADLALDNKDLNAATRDLLNDIEDAGQRAVALTNQLLVFSRKQVLTPVVLNLNAVLKDMESMVRRIISEDIALTFALSPSLGHVRADQSQFEQVIMNLVVNAREAMKRGGRLTIETFNLDVENSDPNKRPELKSGRYVVLTVADTGRGMSAAVKAHVFEPFFTTKGSRKGTGLGLATVHGIVVQSGGSVHIDSETGVGTTFSIYLPLITDAAPLEKSSGALGGTQMGTETILVVEDEDGVRSVLSSVLRRFGYKVLPARSGKEAIEICDRPGEHIHLLLTDVVMPEMGGLELGGCVRARRPHIPILYVSGYVDDALLRHAMLEDGSFFLQKPVAPNLLALKVRQVLDSCAESYRESYDESR